MKRKIRYMAYSAIYTLQSRNTGRHITNGALHANIAVCSERAFMSGRARPGESRKGISKQCQNAIISS